MKRQARVNLYDVDSLPSASLGKVIEKHRQSLKEFLRELLACHIKREMISRGFPVTFVWVYFPMDGDTVVYSQAITNFKFTATMKDGYVSEAYKNKGLMEKYHRTLADMRAEAAEELERQLSPEIVLEDIRAANIEFLANGDVWGNEMKNLEIGT